MLFDPSFDAFSFTLQYCEDNPGTEPRGVNAAILGLKEIEHRQIGVIELNHDLDMDEVTEIFIRINSKGTVLSQSDFVMSKMASDERFGGNMLRKTVDYFCHLAVKPEFYASMLNDESFKASPYADRIKWLANDYEDIYDPDYNDMLRVSFMHRFKRGRLADLVSLLFGRDFATKEYKESIAEESYHTLADGINSFINQYNFSQFLMAIKGAGFIKRKLLNSKMTLDFAYALYLMLKEDKSIPNEQIKRLVQKWFVLTTLTSRYIGSPETVMSRDINSIEEKGFLRFFEEVEASDLSDNFWSVTLPQNLESSSSTTPAFNVFTAAQINRGADSLLISGTKVYDLIHTNGAADVHHIFPKEHLKKNGINKPIKYNQVANYIYLDTQVNKAIGDRPPCEYFSIVTAQCETKEIQLGNIQSAEDLAANLADNCLMPEIKDMDYIDYEAFLIERRKMMAKFIEEYYKKL